MESVMAQSDNVMHLTAARLRATAAGHAGHKE